MLPCRDELYPMPYDSIDWNAARSQIAKEDLYYPHPMIQVRASPLQPLWYLCTVLLLNITEIIK
jgi:hypothetical protein